MLVAEKQALRRKMDPKTRGGPNTDYVSVLRVSSGKQS